ncbi:FAD-binding oxidoreductase [Clostridium perfringens]|uniref:FAD-binding oxidoreductase n=1 Tax=Clostridium perfringens TaxID=1502 RepID=UPI001ABB6BAC|nr:FAD-binding oxidoreductase [Clostridium perfringens]EHK2404179.1 flavohemoprotein [Clostridium perfringens]MBO3333361.1 flavohemoprotein [Clostridium perfringens]MDH2472352.1 FAD-binding oxidoreductase [Clostridium perfringens]MDM0894246.1 FAD-binding oxidoreductase [Clostridium perfringens]MDU1211237.1 FAD-binding oxidoreductase [Clostridium perfringens]
MENVWNGFRQLEIFKIEEEAKDIKSFYLRATDGKPLKEYKCGQFLPLKIETDDEVIKKEMRRYSLSGDPKKDYYRLTIKRVPNGKVSGYFHESINVGDTILAMPPFGKFTLTEDSNKPLVLLSGGIGITPILSMLYGAKEQSRDVYFVEAVLNSDNLALNSDVQGIKKVKNFKEIKVFSEPLESDIKGKDFDEEGFITKEWIKNNLPLNGEFFFCGPTLFMKSIRNSLKDLGVKEDNINFEFFGKEEF